MSTSAFRCPNEPLTSHQQELMREGFAWWRKIHVSCTRAKKNQGDICVEIVRLGDVMVQQTGLLVMSNGRATTQIPIARRLF